MPVSPSSTRWWTILYFFLSRILSTTREMITRLTIVRMIDICRSYYRSNDGEMEMDGEGETEFTIDDGRTSSRIDHRGRWRRWMTTLFAERACFYYVKRSVWLCSRSDVGWSLLEISSVVVGLWPLIDWRSPIQHMRINIFTVSRRSLNTTSTQDVYVCM